METTRTIKFSFITYTDGISAFDAPAIFVEHEEIRRFLGCDHNGSADHERAITDGLRNAGAPDWALDAPGWIDDRGVGRWVD